jgi:hypothetical protein
MKFHKGRATDAVLDSALPPAQKLMMLVYVKHANREGVAWPGATRLATLTGYSLRAVKGHRAQLIEAGVLTVDEELKGKVKKLRIELLRLPTRADIAPVQILHPNTPLPVQNLHPNIHTKESTQYKDAFAEFNRIRGEHDPRGKRELSYSTWGDQFKAACKRAGSPERLLKAWLCYWTHPDFDWWRKTPRSPHGAFMRAKSLPQFLDAADEWTPPVPQKRAVEDTSSPALAKLWLRSHPELFDIPTPQRRDWLADRVSHPELILNRQETA